MSLRLALALGIAALAVATAVGQTMPPPPTIPPPVIPPVVVPTNPPVTTKPTVPKTTGPATRATTSLIIGQVVDTNGRAVPKAVVRLIGDRLIETVLTDPKGRFAFTTIPTDEVVVTASKVGYFDGGYGQRRATGLPLAFSLPYGRVMPNMRIEVFRSAVITGTVVDEAGEPIVGARVVAMRRQFRNGDWQYAAVSSEDTDDQGFYRLYGLEPGEYVVSTPTHEVAAVPGWLGITFDRDGREGVFSTQFYPTTDRRILALPVVVGAGDVRYAVNFQLPVVPARRVTGRLIGDAGGINGDSLRLVPSGAGSSPADEIAGAASGPDGAFTFARVPRGQYRLEFDALRAWARAEVTVDDEDVDLGDIEMKPTVALSGWVEVNRLAGTKEPPPLPRRIPITIEPAEPGLSRAVLVDGAPAGPLPIARFSVTNLIPGRYFVRVGTLPAGWFLASIAADRSNGSNGLDDPIDVGVGDDTSVTVTLTTRGTEIIGSVIDSRLQAASGVAVIVLPIAADGSVVVTSNRVRATRASTAGVFVIRGLPPGDYLIAAIDDAQAENWQDARTLATLRTLAKRITLRNAESLTLQMRVK